MKEAVFEKCIIRDERYNIFTTLQKVYNATIKRNKNNENNEIRTLKKHCKFFSLKILLRLIYPYETYSL